jgi:predicted transcriptional regulator of viral defense system
VAVARRQHGVVSLSQLIGCGFTAGGIQKLARHHRLHRVHAGVYALGPAPLSPLGNRIAAVLAAGPGSLLASRSAGAHYGLITNTSSLIDVMSPQRVRRAGIRAHRMSELAARDRTSHLSIPTTSVARTLLDLASAGRPGELRAALEQAEELRLFDLSALGDVIARNEGQPGVRRLRSSLAAMTIDGARFRSEFERRFRSIARSAGLGEAFVNHVIALPDGPLEVDYFWPDYQLVVECDGYLFHRDRRAFRNDRRRDRRLAAAGIRCLRYVWEDFEQPDAIRRELRRIARLSA